MNNTKLDSVMDSTSPIIKKSKSLLKAAGKAGLIGGAAFLGYKAMEKDSEKDKELEDERALYGARYK